MSTETSTQSPVVARADVRCCGVARGYSCHMHKIAIYRESGKFRVVLEIKMFDIGWRAVDIYKNLHASEESARAHANRVWTQATTEGFPGMLTAVA